MAEISPPTKWLGSARRIVCIPGHSQAYTHKGGCMPFHGGFKQEAKPFEMPKSEAHKFTGQRLILNELSMSQLLATLQNKIKPSKEVCD